MMKESGQKLQSGEFDSAKLEVLLHVHQGQREESLGHRQAIFNYVSLSLAGLMAIAAGVSTAFSEGLDSSVKIALGLIVLAVPVYVIYSVYAKRYGNCVICWSSHHHYVSIAS